MPVTIADENDLREMLEMVTSYDDLTSADISHLAIRCQAECALYSLYSGWLINIPSWLLGEYVVVKTKDPSSILGIESAVIYVDGFLAGRNKAIEFCKNGDIHFLELPDKTLFNPFHRAFVKWLAVICLKNVVYDVKTRHAFESCMKRFFNGLCFNDIRAEANALLTKEEIYRSSFNDWELA